MMDEHEGSESRRQVRRASVSMRGLSSSELHRIFLKSLEDTATGPDSPDKERKPLEVTVKSPLPSPLRAYLFTLTYSVAERQQGAYRSQLVLPEHRGHRGKVHLDTSGGAFVVLGGYEPDLEVFCLWDAGLHDRGEGIPYSKGVQVSDATIFKAANEGMAEQHRQLRGGGPATEVVVAARANLLVQALRRRWDLTTERLLEETL